MRLVELDGHYIRALETRRRQLTTGHNIYIISLLLQQRLLYVYCHLQFPVRPYWLVSSASSVVQSARARRIISAVWKCVYREWRRVSERGRESVWNSLSPCAAVACRLHSSHRKTLLSRRDEAQWPRFKSKDRTSMLMPWPSKITFYYMIFCIFLAFVFLFFM